MKKFIFRTAVCLIALVGSAFGSTAVSAEQSKNTATAVVIKNGTDKEFTSDRMNAAWSAAAEAGQGTVLKLMSDWTPETALTVPVGKTLTLDLNGHIIDRDLIKTRSNGELFVVESGSTLNIIDSQPDAPHKGSAVRGGILTGGRSSDTAGCIDMKKGSTVKIKGCTIMSCATSQDGGAIRMDGVCELTADGTGFLSNYTQKSKTRCYGGAVYIGDGTAFIRNCIFDSNYCEDHGGAIYINDGELQVENTLFQNNHSGNEGGAVYCNDTHNPSMLQGCTYISNSSDENGGAVYISSCKQLALYNSVFSHNTAKNNGGAVYVESDMVILANSTVTDNKAGSFGGGIFVDSLHDIGVQGKVVVRSNTNSSGESNDLCLQSGKASTAYLSNGGLYEGSMIYITSTSKDRILAAKEISKYQSSQYIRANNASAVIDEESEKQVDEEFVSSVTGKGSIMVICGGVGIVIIAVVYSLIKKKKRKKEAKVNDVS